MIAILFSRKTLLPLSLLATLFLAGCQVFTDAPQTTFDPKGPVAQVQLDIFSLTLWVCAFIFVVVASTLLYAVIRYRRRAGEADKEISAHAHGNPMIEVGLIVGSVLLLVVIAFPTFDAAVFSYDVPEEYGDDILEINAVGHQWWWSFEYPELGVLTANEMVIPVGRPVRVHLRAQDVIHSFWIPKLAGKRDMIPNRNNFLWLLADETGEYHGQCAEFCGTSHANMLFRVFSKEKTDFDQWVAQQRAPGRAPEVAAELTGRNLFQAKGCVQCHNVTEVAPGGILGPDLTHFGSRTTIAAAILPKTEANLALWLREPERVKPGNLMTSAVMDQNLTESEIQSLVAFLMSLK